MEIKSLSGEIRNRFRSEIKINGLLQCVTELVLNSLDAKATAVAVRVNILKFRIQVVDNGIGISKSNMDVLGTRYMTNKCYSLADFESKHKYFGYRGESLASIKDLTESMTIMSRSCESDETCSKTLTSTGMSTYTYPHEEAKVTFTKRSEFMPKGLSPILKEVKQINVSLSPTSKNCLQNEILKCFDKDLDIIKWQKFISNKGAQNFFDLIYRKEQKQYETLVPNISNKDLPSYSKKFCNSNGSHKFSHDIFSTLVVIGQLDSKFIVTVSNSNLIILFDQHAVHERIRLENLLQDYMYPNHGNNMVQYKSTKCDQSIKMNFTETDTYILRNFKHLFENMGLSFEIFEDYILIKEIPTCFYNKYPKNVNDKNENLLGLIRVLIMDEISMLQTTRGIVSNIPTAIQHVINTEACRGAIKFGEKLTVKECVKYIMELSKCDLPFQCAHGRPTLVPIMEVESANESIKNWLLPPNLKIFKA